MALEHTMGAKTRPTEICAQQVQKIAPEMAKKHWEILSFNTGWGAKRPRSYCTMDFPLFFGHFWDDFLHLLGTDFHGWIFCPHGMLQCPSISS